jgi:ribulose-5-phosphate 4-epimerase/fuculose-1-phosphate aldolase
VKEQIARYSAKLLADRSALPGAIAFAVKDDILFSVGDEPAAILAEQILSRLNALALVVASPPLPFADLLVRRSPPDTRQIVPTDTENRTFLHDIPFIRAEEQDDHLAERVADLLGQRKGVIVEGIGIIAVGSITVELAYINYSSVFHSTFVKYLQDLLGHGFLLPGEWEMFAAFRQEWLLPLTADGLDFRTGNLQQREDILDALARVGRYTVERGLVDSFFGNISCRAGELIFISQTGASLDALSGCIDPVPFDNSSTTGITASSELLAHRRIYETSGARTILHGHPRFAVVLSMLCEEQECRVADCWKECPKVRYLGDTPVVAGEIGAGGLAKKVPPVIAGPGKAIVFGHGVFTIGTEDFEEPFRLMVEVENWCREEYFRRLDSV